MKTKNQCLRQNECKTQKTNPIPQYPNFLSNIGLYYIVFMFFAFLYFL